MHDHDQLSIFLIVFTGVLVVFFGARWIFEKLSNQDRPRPPHFYDDEDY